MTLSGNQSIFLEDLKILVDQTQFQKLGKEFCLVRMANQANGRGLCLFWLVVSSVPHYKSNLYALSLWWNRLWIAVANIEQLPTPSKLFWVQKQTFMLDMQWRGICCTLETFFCDFKIGCSWGMFKFILLPKIADPWTLKGPRVMTDHVFVWIRFEKLQSDVQLQATRWLLLNRWEMFVPPFKNTPDSCQALLKFLDSWSCFYGMWLYVLQPGL